MNKALAELFIRNDPLGYDRLNRQYWSFDGDERLWVEDRTRNILPEEDKIHFKNLDDENQLLISKSPSLSVSKWTYYASSRDVWNLYEALDERGEREKALKKAIADRFPLEEPPTQPTYQKDGHEYIGRFVLRKFNKV